MRATIEFDMPAEWDELRQHLSGPDAISVLLEIDSHLRSYIKHEEDERVASSMQYVRDLLRRECAARGVPLD